MKNRGQEYCGKDGAGRCESEEFFGEDGYNEKANDDSIDFGGGDCDTIRMGVGVGGDAGRKRGGRAGGDGRL